MFRFIKLSGITLAVLIFLAAPPVHGGLGDLFKKILNPVLDLGGNVLGEVVAASVKLQYGVYDKDPEAKAWADRIFSQIVAVADRKNANYKLTILRPKFVNAFATPGGHIFVTYGLLQRVKSDDELAAVLGHEVGHVVARHSMNNLKHQVAFQIILNKVGDRSDKLKKLGQVYTLFSSLRYSRKNEQEADYIGARYAAAAGYNPLGMKRFLEILKSLSPDDPSRIETSLRSHPPSSRRILRMQEYEDQLPKELLERPMRLSYDFAAKHPLDPKVAKKDEINQEKYVSDYPLEKNQSQAKTSLTTVYFQNFDVKGKPGIAEGMNEIEGKGLYILDEKVKDSGVSSQRINSYVDSKSYTLSSNEIAVQGNTRYRIQVAIGTNELMAKPNPTGYGAVVNVKEFSNRSFVKYQSALIQVLDEDSDFEIYEVEFTTQDRTSKIFLEIGLKNARGQAHFDDLKLFKL